MVYDVCSGEYVLLLIRQLAVCVMQGIISGSLGHWSGSGFTFHAWTCLEGRLADVRVQIERPLYRSV